MPEIRPARQPVYRSGDDCEHGGAETLRLHSARKEMYQRGDGVCDRNALPSDAFAQFSTNDADICVAGGAESALRRSAWQVFRH